MEIWKDIEIEYKGETHTFRPTLEFINHLESSTGRSITSYVMRVATQDIPVVWSAQIFAAALSHVGVRVSPETIYAEYGLAPELLVSASGIVMACLPPNKETQAEKRQKKGGESAGKPRKRTGAKSTE